MLTKVWDVWCHTGPWQITLRSSANQSPNQLPKSRPAHQHCKEYNLAARTAPSLNWLHQDLAGWISRLADKMPNQLQSSPPYPQEFVAQNRRIFLKLASPIAYKGLLIWKEPFLKNVQEAKSNCQQPTSPTLIQLDIPPQQPIPQRHQHLHFFLNLVKRKAVV